MNTRAVKRTATAIRPPRVVFKKVVDLSDEQDKFWGVPTPKLEYVYIDSDVYGTIMLADYRKKVKLE